MVGTFAYVNPVVAVLLGWLVLHEDVTVRTVAAMALILGSVLWIQLSSGPHGSPAKRPALERGRSACDEDPAELGHSAAHRAVVNPLAHPHDHPTENLPVFRE